MDRRPYDPNLRPHPTAPIAQTYPAFSPGALAGLRDQLSRGYGTPPEEQEAYLRSMYGDTTQTYVPQPLSGVLDDFSKNSYQQYGMDTGSPFLNALLGYSPGTPPAPGTGATGQYDPTAMAAAAAAEAERLRLQREAEEAARNSASSMMWSRMNDFGGGRDAQGYGGLGQSGYNR